MEFWTAPVIWRGQPVVCIGGGPSLTQEQCDYVKGRARVIAINDAYKMAPWADVLYACDNRWWLKNKGVPGFKGLRVMLENPHEEEGLRQYDIKVLHNTGREGLEREPTGLRNGRNSGYQAINLAVHFGARRIILLGYDMRPDGDKTHWFGDHEWPSKPTVYKNWISYFHTMRADLGELGVHVVNCTPDSALDAFPIVPLERAFPD